MYGVWSSNGDILIFFKINSNQYSPNFSCDEIEKNWNQHRGWLKPVHAVDFPDNTRFKAWG